jgi:putative transposase
VIDTVARRMVGGQVPRSAKTGCVLDAVERALYDRRPFPQGGVVHQGDRGSQYLAIRSTERLADAGIEPPVRSIADSYHKSLAETLIGLFKTQAIRRRGPWRSIEAVAFATLEWLDWFTHRRRLEPLGNIPPAEAEARYYPQIAGQAMAAWLRQNPGSDKIASENPGPVHTAPTTPCPNRSGEPGITVPAPSSVSPISC